MNSLQFKAFSALLRFKLSFAIALTTLVGFICACHALSWNAVPLCVGIFLLAAAASALNQVQERAHDAGMERTRKRPLPLKFFSVRQVVLIAAVVGCTGFLLLFFAATVYVALLGLFTLAWYNGVYTPLKKRWGYAFLIGGLCGALPPVIGFLAAGGNRLDECVFLALFMYLWQVPHFLLIFREHRSAYAAAGLPVPRFLTKEITARVAIFLGFLATAGSTLLFPLCGVVKGVTLGTILLIVNLLALVYFYIFLMRPSVPSYFKPVFYGLLVFQGLIFVILIV